MQTMNNDATPMDPIKPLRLQAINPTLHGATPDLSNFVQQVQETNAKAIAKQLNTFAKNTNLALNRSGAKLKIDPAAQFSQCISAAIPSLVHQIQSSPMNKMVKALDRQFFGPKVDYSALFNNTGAINQALEELLSTTSFAISFQNFEFALQDTVDKLAVPDEAPKDQIPSHPEEGSKDSATTKSIALSATYRTTNALTALLDQIMEFARKKAISHNAASLIAQSIVTLAALGLTANPVLVITLIWSFEQVIQRLLRSPDELGVAKD